MILYHHPISGNAHKVKLTLAVLKLEAEQVIINLPAGEHKEDWFKALNPFGQVPVLRDGDVTLFDSQAIIKYLVQTYAPNSQWYGPTPKRQARIDQFLAVAAEKLAAGPAKARSSTLFKRLEHVPPAQQIASGLLSTLNDILSQQAWLVDDQPSLADLAHYAYIKRAPEGGIELSEYQNILAWLTRVEALEGFIAMPEAKEIFAGA
ncbi:glutathione S-transferase family protein [Salinibius halmophilus]|uniref:glutathione S-transferase family protein n=1 Tax=Salinibius halmophilus TaxID=1853216 RepID=UPI000E665AFB|nr:glutathione S-transferase family protein [Salinibius halmophilus]